MVVSCLGCLVALASIHAPGTLPAGMLVVNPLSQLVQGALLLLAIPVLLLVSSARFTEHVGEYCALMLFATAAMMLLVSTQNLLLIFIAIEFLSLSLYVLTAFNKQSQPAAEAGLKYFLFGGMSAGILLFGVSLLYGLSGSLALEPIAAAVHASHDPLLTLALVMLVAGLGFKIAAAPFHMWAPEVYQGAPSWSAALIASSSKVASFFVLFLIVSVGLAGASGLVSLVVLLSVVSMIWGNLAAIAQSSVRRLLPYSAIGHAGYMLIAVAIHTQQSFAALIYYVITYALATVGAFGVLVALDEEKVDSITDFAGLAKRAPDLAFCLLLFLLSLAGIPPLAGFFAKFYLFIAALHAGLLWLVLLALAMSVVSFYYYLKVLKQAYVATPPTEDSIRTPMVVRLTLWTIAALVLLLGCLPDLLLNRIAAALR